MTNLILGGCNAVPYNTLPAQACCRDNVDPQTINLIKPGSTSRREVLLVLGEPDEVWLSEMRFEYNHEQAPAVTQFVIVGVALPRGGFGFDVPRKYHYAGQRIYIEFDERGIVTKREFHRYERSQPVEQTSRGQGTERILEIRK